MKCSWLFCGASVVSVLLMVGCSSTYNVGTANESESSYNQFTHEVAGEDLYLHLKNGTMMEGTLIEVSGDSILWKNAGNESLSRIAIPAIDKVVCKNASLGALEGGLITSAAYGVALLAAGGPPETKHGIPEVTTVETGWVALTGSAAVLAGVVPGALVGHRYQYILQPSPAANGRSQASPK